MDDVLISHSWDRQYAAGRYQHQAPVKFVKTILKYKPRGEGLYVGCGNGRNYLPLVLSGLDIKGIDVSKVAISQLLKKTKRVSCKNILNVSENYDYVVSIQSYQHGDYSTVYRYFTKTVQILRKNGLLFLRINSASTVPWHAHKIIEKNKHGGFTIQYHDGPKQGLKIHFFTESEICSILGNGMTILHCKETSQPRKKPKSGTWQQLEMIIHKT